MSPRLFPWRKSPSTAPETDDTPQKLVVNGVRVDKVLALPLEAIENIPADQRESYLFRGIHLGRLALNLMQGKSRVNPYDDNYMHVTPDYSYARHHAVAPTWVPPSDPNSLQFDTSAVADFHRLTGHRREQFPGLVVGLPLDYAERFALHHPNNAQVIGEPVRFSELDTHSQQFLGNLFEIDLTLH